MLDDFFRSGKRNFKRIGNKIDLHRNGRRELGKIIILGKIPLDMRYRKAAQCHPMPILHMLLLSRDDFDAGFAIAEMYNSNHALFVNRRLAALLVGEAVGDGDMTIALCIDTCHVFAEESAVGGGVAELVDSDVIVDHLMENRVLDERFRQVDADVDAEDEVLVAIAAKEALLATRERHLAEEALGMRELNRNRRKGASKEAGVVVVEAGLYVGDRGFQSLNKSKITKNLTKIISSLSKKAQKDPKKLSRFEFLVDHCSDEVVEAEIAFGLAGFVKGRLRIGGGMELRVKTTAELVEEGTLFFGGSVGEFIGIDEGSRAFCRFAKMLQMSEFRSLWRALHVVAFVALHVHFHLAFLCDGA